MKQTFGILVSTLYIILMIGVPFSEQQCSMKTEMQMMESSEANCCCETNSCELDSFNMIINDLNSNTCCSFETPNKKGCCTTEEKIVKWNSDEQLLSSHKTIFIDKELTFQYKSIVYNLDFYKPKANLVFLDLPPPQTKPKQILQHQFTFYG